MQNIWSWRFLAKKMWWNWFICSSKSSSAPIQVQDILHSHQLPQFTPSELQMNSVVRSRSQMPGASPRWIYSCSWERSESSLSARGRTGLSFLFPCTIIHQSSPPSECSSWLPFCVIWAALLQCPLHQTSLVAISLSRQTFVCTLTRRARYSWQFSPLSRKWHTGLDALLMAQRLLIVRLVHSL